MGDQKDIDTKPFREATWYYIQSIKGIRHDDYNYGKVCNNHTPLIAICPLLGKQNIRYSIQDIY